MPIIKTQQLKPGMVLVKEVTSHTGQTLLPKGIQLAEKHILNLKAWGITEVVIQGEGESVPEHENIDPAKLAKVKKEAKSLFRHSNQDQPAIAELMRLFCLNRLKKMPGTGDINVQ